MKNGKLKVFKAIFKTSVCNSIVKTNSFQVYTDITLSNFFINNL